jgi:predicted transcriptional regulator
MLMVAIPGKKMTDILKEARLSFKQFKEKSPYLINKGFWASYTNDGRINYRTTGKGIELIKKFRNLEAMLGYPNELDLETNSMTPYAKESVS